jgi:phosphatidylglycerophosphatase A
VPSSGKKYSTGTTAIAFKNMTVVQKSWYILGVGIGSGLSPKAPGTAGSLAVLVLTPLWVYLGWEMSSVVILIAALIGIPICGKTAALMAVHDDGRIVWDEFVGQSMTLLPLVALGKLHDVSLISSGYVVLAFVLFRIFDILKPWPISYFDRHVHGGFGIMFDDILAGLFALLVLWGGLLWL